MPHTYRQLRDALAIESNPLLSVFEQYCRDMQGNTRVLEWSCKVTGEAFEGARFLHTARLTEFSQAQEAVDRLYAAVRPGAGVPAPDRGLFNGLRGLAREVGQGVALGYAEHGPARDRRTELKLYVATPHVDAVRPLIERLVSDGAGPPAGTPRVMIGASIDDRNGSRCRVYYLWDQATSRRAIPAEWLTAWCTAEEIGLIEGSSSRTVSISFKDGQRDMLYLSAPFTHAELNHVVLTRLANHPLAYGQLGHLRWIGLSKRRDGLGGQELNVYFNSVFA